MTTDRDALDALARELHRAQLHARALRAESLRLVDLARREQERFADLYLIALLHLAEVRPGAAAPTENPLFYPGG